MTEIECQLERMLESTLISLTVFSRGRFLTYPEGDIAKPVVRFYFAHCDNRSHTDT